MSHEVHLPAARPWQQFESVSGRGGGDRWSYTFDSVCECMGALPVDGLGISRSKVFLKQHGANPTTQRGGRTQAVCGQVQIIWFSGCFTVPMPQGLLEELNRGVPPSCLPTRGVLVPPSFEDQSPKRVETSNKSRVEMLLISKAKRGMSVH